MKTENMTIGELLACVRSTFERYEQSAPCSVLNVAERQELLLVLAFAHDELAPHRRLRKQEAHARERVTRLTTIYEVKP